MALPRDLPYTYQALHLLDADYVDPLLTRPYVHSCSLGALCSSDFSDKLCSYMVGNL